MKNFCNKLLLIFEAFLSIIVIKLRRFQPRMNGVQNDALVVSLTSYGKRVGRFLPYVLYSLLQQQMLPAYILVWLDREHWNEDNLPAPLKKMQRYGVRLRFCPDVRSYKKLVYMLPEYKDKVIVTVDDDLYYPKDLLTHLWEAHRLHPRCVCSVIAHEIGIKSGKLLPYRDWHKNLPNSREGLLLPIGAGGILYPPGSLHPDVLTANYMKLCPTADDLWFWCQALRQGTRHFCLGALTEKYLPFDRLYFFEQKLNTSNVKGGGNDIQLERLVNEYALLPLMIERKKRYEES